MEIRPTLQALKSLRKAGLLSRTDERTYDGAAKIDDKNAKVRNLASMDLSHLDVNLLNDGRTLLSGGAFPDIHRASSKAAGQNVYELRDRAGAAWRGAGIADIESNTMWLLHVLPHDRFHGEAASYIKKQKNIGRLGPTQLDLRILALDRQRRGNKANRVEVLQALIAALQRSQAIQSPAPVNMPKSPSLESVEMFVRVSDVPADPGDWDPSTAHTRAGMVSVEIELAAIASATRAWLLQVCLPFLQDDQSMIEAIYLQTLSVLVLVPESKLMQLLSLDDSDLSGIAPYEPSMPTHLHYTAKASLTEAYVEHKAVRAVCGAWWIPIGDETTHSELPICEVCESERPFADAVSRVLRAGS